MDLPSPQGLRSGSQEFSIRTDPRQWHHDQLCQLATGWALARCHKGTLPAYYIWPIIKGGFWFDYSMIRKMWLYPPGYWGIELFPEMIAHLTCRFSLFMEAQFIPRSRLRRWLSFRALSFRAVSSMLKSRREAHESCLIFSSPWERNWSCKLAINRGN